MFEAHGISFPCTELLLFNYAKVNTVFNSMAPLKMYANYKFSLPHSTATSWPCEHVSTILETIVKIL